MSKNLAQAFAPTLGSYSPVYGDVLDEAGGLRVRDDDAFRRHGQRHFAELLGAGSGLWVSNTRAQQ